jgi:hypothetical protein
MMVPTGNRTIHASHEMARFTSEVRAPAGTPRFYSVRRCKRCGAEQMKHPAGQQSDEALFKKCRA